MLPRLQFPGYDLLDGQNPNSSFGRKGNKSTSTLRRESEQVYHLRGRISTFGDLRSPRATATGFAGYARMPLNFSNAQAC